MIETTSLRPGKNPMTFTSQTYPLIKAPSWVVLARPLRSSGRLAPVKASCGSMLFR
ncbi:Uncharacterised protein [Mycobacteroides abscessus subsp. abscessus]|nr:Uncharacterised protein [Mycobacteroides abscessus subsp. abscessus]